MNNLPDEICQVIAFKLDGDSLYQMVFCNKKWFQILSNQSLWQTLLFCHFKSMPLPKLTAYQSYQWYDCWSERVDWILMRFLSYQFFSF
jgi:hypothetical protein